MGYEILASEALIELLHERDKSIVELQESNTHLESLNKYLDSETDSLRNELHGILTKFAETEMELKNEREANAPLRAVACDLAIENQAFKKRLKRC